MKVLLSTDVKGLGKQGDVVNASDGYARNFLFPKKLATPVTAQVLTELQNRENAAKHKAETELQEAKATAAKLEGQTVRIHANAGEHGRLFGSVTTKEVAAALETAFGITVDKRKLLMEDVKTYGNFAAEVKLFSGVSAHFFVLVSDESHTKSHKN